MQLLLPGQATEVTAAHVGAGSFSRGTARALRGYLRKILAQRKGPQEIVRQLEKDGRCNCGYGGMCAQDGEIENEACIMQENGSFSAVCMVPSNISACSAAEHLMKLPNKEKYVKPLALIYKDTCHIWRDMPENKNIKDSRDNKNNIDKAEISSFLDTVAAMKIGNNTTVCISSSSGPKKKLSGRIGPCSVYGANTFANEKIAICISGTGEALIRSSICRRIREKIERELFEEIEDELKMFMDEEKEFPYMAGICLFQSTQQKIFLLHFQTSQSFVYGYAFENKIEAIYHIQPPGSVFVRVSRIERESTL